MRTLLKTSLLVVLAISMSACGFHLRGQLPISEAANVLFVDAERSAFKTSLAKRLVSNGATLADSASTSKMTLSFSEPVLERQTKTVDGSGKVSSYQLYSTLDYVLTNPQGEVVSEKTMSESRSYAADETRVLQQEREEKELIEDMNNELVLRLVRVLSKI